MSRIEPAGNETKISPATIVTFGDSITAANWPHYFAERLQVGQLGHLSVLKARDQRKQAFAQ